MSAFIEINDCFDDLKAENLRLIKSFEITKKCFVLLEKYRKCLNTYRKCKCIDKNNGNINKLENEYKTTVKKMMKEIHENNDKVSKLDCRERDNVEKRGNNVESNEENVITTDVQDISDLITFETNQSNSDNQYNIIYVDNSSNPFGNFGEEIEMNGGYTISIVDNENQVIDNQSCYSNDNNVVNLVSNDYFNSLNQIISYDPKPNQNEVNAEANDSTQRIRPKRQIKRIRTDSNYDLLSDDSHESENVDQSVDNDSDFDISGEISPNVIKQFDSSHSYKQQKECDICGHKFWKKKDLNNHLKSHQVVNDTDVQYYTCGWPGCDARYKKIGFLKAHQLTHSENKPYECLECGESFVTQSKLDKHYKTHYIG